MLRLLLRTCIGACRSKRHHFMPRLHQQARHILGHTTGRNLRAPEETVNKKNFHD
jgi:hypothetical protein